MSTQKTKYYHVSPIEVNESIRTNGLLLNNHGQLFVMNALHAKYCGQRIYLPGHIARTQLFLKHFDLFEISSEAITDELQADNVGELTSPHQFIINHAIAPKYIKWKGRYTLG